MHNQQGIQSDLMDDVSKGFASYGEKFCFSKSATTMEFYINKSLQITCMYVSE